MQYMLCCPNIYNHSLDGGCTNLRVRPRPEVPLKLTYCTVHSKDKRFLNFFNESKYMSYFFLVLAVFVIVDM